MRIKMISFCITLLVSSITFIPLASSNANTNSVTSLDVAGFVVSWPQTMYMPTGCSSFEFKYSNGAAYEFLQVGFQLTDPYGDSITNVSLVGAPPGRSGIWDRQICAHQLKSGLGPYKMKVFIQDYSTRGGGSLEKYADILFTPRPGSSGSTSTQSNQNTKLITCKKGTLLKIYTGKNPKCPRGWKKVN